MRCWPYWHADAGEGTLGAALFYIGLATLLTATVGMLAAKHLARSAAYSLLVSMGIPPASLGLRLKRLPRRRFCT